MSFQMAYIPIGVDTFHRESAEDQFQKSISLLRSICPETKTPPEMLLSTDALEKYLEQLEAPDLIVLQNITFANAAFATEVLRRFSAPIVLWTLREPVIDGGRLRLNSLTGAYSAANAIHAFRREEKFSYVFGSPTEETVRREITAAYKAALVRYTLKGAKIAAIGHTPQGFGFGRALDSEITRTFGVLLESIEARELIEKAKKLSEEEIQMELQESSRELTGLSRIPQKNVLDNARLLKTYRNYVRENNIKAISSRCWPDFFTSFGTPVCTVLSMLNAEGVMASCESDVYGALSMYIGYLLTGTSTFFGDPVSLDEEKNTITFWHCGMAACNLARADSGAQVGVHPNRKIGPTMEFGCKPCKEVTVFRVGRKPDASFRFLVFGGEALDVPRQFLGTSIVVKSEGNAEQIVKSTVQDGWEPHYIVIYADVKKELNILGDMLHIPVANF